MYISQYSQCVRRYLDFINIFKESTKTQMKILEKRALKGKNNRTEGSGREELLLSESVDEMKIQSLIQKLYHH